MQQLSDSGVDFIAQFEGFVDHPYNDPSNYATIGYGHLLHLSPVTSSDWKRWGHISTVQGKKLLKQDAFEAERTIRENVKVPLNQNEFDALVSFIFNVGAGAFKTSTLLRRLNAGDRKGAANEFLKWNKSAGRVLAGLTRRREDERKLFLKKSKDSDPLTKDERELVNEYDRLIKKGGHLSRRSELRYKMIDRRKQIYAAAQKTGWDRHHRRERYHALLDRTR